jgi:hypothetical protein
MKGSARYMNVPIRSAIVALCFCISAKSAISKTSDSGLVYRNSHISFAYPTDLYKRVVLSDRIDDTSRLRSYDLVRRGDNWDEVTICEDFLSSCATNDSQTSPYWLDADTGQLTLYDQTTIVTHRKILGEDIYEGVALCPSTDNDGRSAAYGGECYVGVKTNGRQTFSLKYWIGPNESRAPNHSRTEEMDRARKLLQALGGPR